MRSLFALLPSINLIKIEQQFARKILDPEIAKLKTREHNLLSQMKTVLITGHKNITENKAQKIHNNPFIHVTNPFNFA